MQNDKEKKIVNLGRLDLKLIKKINSENPKSPHDEDYGFSKAKAHEDFEKMIRSPNHLVSDEAMKTKKINVDLNSLELSLNEISKLTNEELLKLLSGENHKGLIRPTIIQLISNEILSRQIKEASKPHWTVTPTFIVGCIASILAAISIMVTIYFSVFYKS